VGRRVRISATILGLGTATLAATTGCGGGSADSGKPIACGVPAATGAPLTLLPPPAVAPCDAQGWCWEAPLPFRDGIGTIWHRPDQTIIVSDRGYAMRLRNGVWQALPALPKPPAETGIISVGDIWAAGDNIFVAGGIATHGIIWAYDGAAWTAHSFFEAGAASFIPFHIWGTREREVMAVGAGGARLLSGDRWSDARAPRDAGQGVWGCGDSYVAGFFGGSATNAIGEPPSIARYRGGAWQESDVPEGNVQFSAISGATNDDVFASGFVNGASRNVAWHFDGTVWADLALADSPGLLDIVALGGGRALAAGLGSDGIARAWRYDGSTWSVVGERSLLGLSAATPEDILGHSATGVHQFDGAQWSDPFPLPLDGALGAKGLTGLWGSGASMFLIASDGSIFQRVGGDWSAMTTPAAASRTLNGIWGSSTSDVFVVGSRGLVWHWNGAAWSEMLLPTITASPDLRAVWGPVGGPVYAVGSAGAIVRFDGTDWIEDDRVAEDLVGIWGTGPADIWAVGVRGLIAHYDGTAWDDSHALGGNLPSNVAGIWGSGPNQIFVVGGTTVWRYDGAAWTATALPTAAAANAVWGRAANDAYIVGATGMAFRWDGTAWNDIRAEHPWTFNAIWGDGAQIRAVGDLGTISVR